ncbi:MAG TPA: hypothetical protein PLB48_07170 [Treponema sp.]|nr:hypothetical protein [Treponema sp.]HPC71568.1 hypothetical protein [Treponema sp.]HRS05002.1 hypothetical protein [Treponema sp.]HRU29329.1 hypothetical protein [Treponema sp.]
MTETQWTQFNMLKESYKRYVDALSRALPQLPRLLTDLIGGRAGPSYPLETPVVYNSALDDVQKESTIKLILVADNPGRREQSAAERRYLVGPSGKLADNFFKQHPELNIDFRQHVLILNKTPIHTPRTIDLRDLARLGGDNLAEAIRNSQIYMARLIYRCHQIFAREAELWIIGYSEMGRGKLFEAFTEEIRALYSSQAPANLAAPPTLAAPADIAAPPTFTENSISRQKVYLYRHFSMNQFSVDFSKQKKPEDSTQETLHRIGSQYRKRILGW